MQTYYSFDEARTTAIAHELAARLHAGDIVLLRGDLGAGKSVFARGLARAWGVEGHVTSPTFTTMQQYDGARGRFYHFDLYRLDDAYTVYVNRVEPGDVPEDARVGFTDEDGDGYARMIRIAAPGEEEA